MTGIDAADGSSAPRWSLDRTGRRVQLRLSGEWRSADRPPAQADLPAELDSGRPGGAGRTTLTFDLSDVGRWDSALALFVAQTIEVAAERDIAVDREGLPPPLRRLLELSESAPRTAGTERRDARPGPVVALGLAAIGAVRTGLDVTTLLGDVTLRAGATLRRRSHIRLVDVLTLMREAGAAALMIVAIVNLLVGGILAFVGAVQLQQFGAGILVADLVGIAMAREMSAVMTAIVIAGRTGGAYAAHLATMQGNEEIDALTTFGISPVEHLVLPRVIALTIMMPLLYVYGCAIGLFGGFAVGISVLDLSPVAYIEQTRAAIRPTEFILGFVKSATFGALVALAGCYLGIKAGRSAADVGRAATAAVVAGIIGVIALDAIFAVVTHFAGI